MIVDVYIQGMYLKEACIYKRPKYSLSAWYLRAGLDVTRVRGKWKGEDMESAPLRYFDTEQQVAIDTQGTVWHIPPGASRANHLPEPATGNLLSLYRQPRWVRQPAVLVIADDCPELCQLLSKGSKHDHTV